MSEKNLNKLSKKFVTKYWGNPEKYSEVVDEVMKMAKNWALQMIGGNITDKVINDHITLASRMKGIMHIASFKRGYETKKKEVIKLIYLNSKK